MQSPLKSQYPAGARNAGWGSGFRAYPSESSKNICSMSEIGDKVIELHRQGIPSVEIAHRLNVAQATVSYHARCLGASIDQRCRRRYEWSSVQAFYDEGNSVRDCTREFGFSTASWHDAVQRGLITPRPSFRPAEEIFAANTRRHRGHLKQRLLRLGLKDGTCERCGLDEWHDGPLSMALHHINGDRLDNRLENLELLCPNCHSQTSTYSGRNGYRGGHNRPAAADRSPPEPGRKSDA